MKTANIKGKNLISLKLTMRAILRCITANVTLQKLLIGDITLATQWYW